MANSKEFKKGEKAFYLQEYRNILNVEVEEPRPKDGLCVIRIPDGLGKCYLKTVSSEALFGSVEEIETKENLRFI